jgi:hypothetical protein
MMNKIGKQIGVGGMVTLLWLLCVSVATCEPTVLHSSETSLHQKFPVKKANTPLAGLEESVEEEWEDEESELEATKVFYWIAFLLATQSVGTSPIQPADSDGNRSIVSLFILHCSLRLPAPALV